MLRVSWLRLRCAPSLLSFRGAPGFRPAPADDFDGADDDPAVVPVSVEPDFITEEEERLLLHYTGHLFARLPFADGHFDRLIEQYKEFYRNGDDLALRPGEAILDAEVAGADSPRSLDERRALIAGAFARCRARAQAFLPEVPLQPRAHFLQLHPEGFIRPHLDEARSSSAIVAGVTLGSARVMRLTNPAHPGAAIEMLLAPRSLYVLSGSARYDWEHSVDCLTPDAAPPAAGSVVDFDGAPTEFRRHMRTALIFRGLSPMELFMHRRGSRLAKPPSDS
jgi:hypothetical protein